MIQMMTRRRAGDGTVTWMELASKKLLRRAMADSKGRAAQGLGPDCSSIPKLALAARVSNATIGFLVSEGTSGRKSCTVSTAEAVAAAVGWDLDELFIRKVESGTAA